MRGNGILDNEMYTGKIVWNRQRFVKVPDTRKRQAQPNPGGGMGNPGRAGINAAPVEVEKIDREKRTSISRALC